MEEKLFPNIFWIKVVLPEASTPKKHYGRLEVANERGCTILKLLCFSWVCVAILDSRESVSEFVRVINERNVSIAILKHHKRDGSSNPKKQKQVAQNTLSCRHEGWERCHEQNSQAPKEKKKGLIEKKNNFQYLEHSGWISSVAIFLDDPSSRAGKVWRRASVLSSGL